MDTSYSKIAKFWNLGMTVSGWNSGLERYVKRVPIALPPNPKILDIGCGPGILGFSFLKKFPDAEIIATDVDEKMISAAECIALKNKISPAKLTLAQSDVNCPNKITLRNGEVRDIPPEYFDLIIAGGVLEHSDLQITIPALTNLLKTGGTLLIIGMNEKSLIGKVYKVLYKFHLLPEEHLIKELTFSGYGQISSCPLNLKDFPANLSRVGIIARK